MRLLMCQKENCYHYRCGYGRTQVEFVIHSTDGFGLCGFLYGGDLPHVGGAAFAAPCTQSGTKTSQDYVKSFSAEGHKDVIVAQMAAEKICIITQENVSVSAGIHVNEITQEELGIVIEHCMEAVDEFLKDYTDRS